MGRWVFVALLPMLLGSATPLAGRTLATPEGGTLRLADLGARAVVLDVWATWCEPCREALPRLEALARDGAPRGLAVVALAQDEDAARVREMAAALGLKQVRVALDRDHAVAAALDPPSLPTTYVLDAAGTVRARFEGYHPGDEARIRAAVEGLLGAP
jgi:thioredoxin-like negative regulator of GroEL